MFNSKNFGIEKMGPGPNFLSLFSPECKKHNQIAPFPLKVKRGYQITSFLGICMNILHLSIICHS
jgi:hypothetical protein